MDNSEIAAVFNRYADLLGITGSNQFRVRAYRTAARNIDGIARSIAAIVEEGKDLTQEIPGVGADLAGKITEIVNTRKLTAAEDLKKTIPEGLVDIMEIAGLGPKRAFRLYNELGIKSVDELGQAAREKRISKLKGFKEKIEQTILDDIGRRAEVTVGQRFKLSDAASKAEPLLAYLRNVKGVLKAEAAGSYRRGQETVGDVDILIIRDQDSPVMNRFAGYPEVGRILAHGPSRSAVVLKGGLQVDVRAVPPESYGAALNYFTGSKPHNIAIRLMGVKRKLKINEYGVFKGEKRIGGATEEEVYKSVGLPYIEPELRENRGELEAAVSGKLPKLITLDEIRGDLHCHSNYSDGRSSLREMAEAARQRKYEYLAISDHSDRLSGERLEKRNREIDELNKEFKGFMLLKGMEVEILPDGSLGTPSEVLSALDVVVVSVHSEFDLRQKQQTDRVLRALAQPFFVILGHPTHRRIGIQPPMAIDIERVMLAAKEFGCALEVNGQPERLDLNDINSKMAKDMGIPIVISSDAHQASQLSQMRNGVTQARRGWLEAGNVLNTRSLPELKTIIAKLGSR